MFNEKTCKKCGLCLTECPFMEMPVEKAKQEIERIIQTGSLGEVAKSCAGCGYCNVICPTQSNPLDLRKQILEKKSAGKGAVGLGLICEEVPANLMSMAMEYEKEEKEENLKAYTNPLKSDTAFYLGCSLSYIYTDLAKSRLFDEFPKIGGMKYCCGGYVNRTFGEEETKIKGWQLLDRFHETGIQKVITFCPGCDHMLQDVFPSLLNEFKIEVQPVFEYLLERHKEGKLTFPNPLNRKITFHDSCAWRSVDSKIYEGPRKLLEIMGAEVVEMKHNRKKSICCGSPIASRNPAAADRVVEKRIAEAKEAGAEMIAVSCSGCFALNKKAAEHNIPVFNITELAQMAIHEEPPHRLAEISNALNKKMFETISKNPDLLKARYTIKDGKVIPL
ncbi:MAG: (Fe-S)-binding protein [Proteobacteria bacterium]|nr:(Fe-S)-binding protein [Pseudomonadota bacterium]MBU4471338.1 (Fe-S)-binding protein [Pseudomonadota bacterium]MCG2751659.1 (Fe-S)-binding protein [Desulfobacteraceae bacterium]